MFQSFEVKVMHRCEQGEEMTATYVVAQRLDAPGHHWTIKAWNVTLYPCLLGCIGKDNLIQYAADNKDVDTFELSCDIILRVGKAE
jgi:hypothetical protein